MKYDERTLRAALTIAGDAGSEKIGMHIAEHGICESFDMWLSGDGPQSLTHRLPNALRKAESMIDSLPERKSRFVIPSDDEWPTPLDDLEYGAPLGLWVTGNGNLRTMSDRMVAIVGARAATAYGERIASELASQAAGARIVTISGAAYGIDAAAHRGSLAAGGVTVAVLACGIDVAYPAAHAGLLERIAHDGVIISEAPFGAAPHKRHFLVRNRLIAAMSSVTVVVEAALRSGSLSTSNWAAAINREVWGVPGPMSSATSAGVHRAIRDGVMRIMSDFTDVLNTFPAEASVSLGAVEDRVVAVLNLAPGTVEFIAEQCAELCSPADVVAILTLLEVTGRARQLEGLWSEL